jgi:hypothetical protein
MELNLCSLQEFRFYMWKGIEQSADCTKLLVSYHLCPLQHSVESTSARMPLGHAQAAQLPQLGIAYAPLWKSIPLPARWATARSHRRCRDVNIGLRVTAHIANVPRVRNI